MNVQGGVTKEQSHGKSIMWRGCTLLLSLALCMSRVREERRETIRSEREAQGCQPGGGYMGRRGSRAAWLLAGRLIIVGGFISAVAFGTGTSWYCKLSIIIVVIIGT